VKFVAGQGCTYCNLTGYRGRVAVYEMIEIDRPLADAVRRGDIEAFGRMARQSQGYVPIAQGAIDLALKGVTSLAEAMSVGSGLEEYVEQPPVLEVDDHAAAQILEKRA
jgi:MSHA biogenesis protein MshE